MILEQEVGKPNQSSEDISQKVQKQVLKNAPFFVIMEGTMSGK